MKMLSAVLFVLLLASLSQAQQTWQRTYGGTGDDEGYSVQQTSDGGYIIAGYYESLSGYTDVYLIKTNASGDTLWTRTYGDTIYYYGWSVRQTSDGGYIVAELTSSSQEGDVYLIKTNASGDTLWTRLYRRGLWNVGWSVQQTTDGGYIVAGTTGTFTAESWDVYLIKTNASGDTLWTRTYGGTDDDEGYSVQQTSDGGYIITGETYSFGAGNYDVYLIKTNASGDTLWTKTYGGGITDVGNSVQQTSDGGYIIAGYTNSFGAGSHDVYLIKTNASGDTIWTRTYGGTGTSGGTSDDEGYSVQQTSDGGYIVAGYLTPLGQTMVMSTSSRRTPQETHSGPGLTEVRTSTGANQSGRPQMVVTSSQEPLTPSGQAVLMSTSSRRTGMGMWEWRKKQRIG